MQQQLRFDAMDAGRLLQSVDDVGEQFVLDLAAPCSGCAFDEDVADHALGSFINKEEIAKHLSALDGGVSRQDLCIDVTQDHLGRTAIVPRQQTEPALRFLVEEIAKIGGSEMPEVENFHWNLIELRAQRARIQGSVTVRGL